MLGARLLSSLTFLRVNRAESPSRSASSSRRRELHVLAVLGSLVHFVQEAVALPDHQLFQSGDLAHVTGDIGGLDAPSVASLLEGRLEGAGFSLVGGGMKNLDRLDSLGPTLDGDRQPSAARGLGSDRPTRRRTSPTCAFLTVTFLVAVLFGLPVSMRTVVLLATQRCRRHRSTVQDRMDAAPLTLKCAGRPVKEVERILGLSTSAAHAGATWVIMAMKLQQRTVLPGIIDASDRRRRRGQVVSHRLATSNRDRVGLPHSCCNHVQKVIPAHSGCT